MKVNPIEAVRKITADLAYYTRQLLEKRVEQQEKQALQKRNNPKSTSTQTEVQFEQMMEKVPSHHTVNKPAPLSAVAYDQLPDLHMLSTQYEHSPLTHQRIAHAQRAYELSMSEQSLVTIEPFDSRA